jgi:hypothetical protein
MEWNFGLAVAHKFSNRLIEIETYFLELLIQDHLLKFSLKLALKESSMRVFLWQVSFHSDHLR